MGPETKIFSAGRGGGLGGGRPGALASQLRVLSAPGCGPGPPLPQVCLKYYEHELVELACQCPAVVCCRCSPTQKAHIVKLLQQHTGRRTCAIGERPHTGRRPVSLPAGPRLLSVREAPPPHTLFPASGDGGNDVSMIQAADCGIGIEGKVRRALSLPPHPPPHLLPGAPAHAGGGGRGGAHRPAGAAP